MSRTRITLPTRVGHAEWGDNRFRGYSVREDLAGVETTTSLLALAVTGRRIDESERLMLDDLAAVTNVADPRIWPLKLVRVAAAYGRPLAAMAAAALCLDGAAIGEESTGRAAQSIVQLGNALATAGLNPAEVDERVLEEHCQRWLAGQSRPVGYDVPFRRRSERVDILFSRVAARGRGELPYWRLFERSAVIVWRLRKVQPNMPAAGAAVLLDMGFTPAQIGPLMTALAAAAFWANAFEGSEQAPACLQTLPLETIRYVGPQPRLSPRAVAARSK